MFNFSKFLKIPNNVQIFKSIRYPKEILTNQIRNSKQNRIHNRFNPIKSNYQPSRWIKIDIFHLKNNFILKIYNPFKRRGQNHPYPPRDLSPSPSKSPKLHPRISDFQKIVKRFFTLENQKFAFTFGLSLSLYYLF